MTSLQCLGKYLLSVLPYSSYQRYMEIAGLDSDSIVPSCYSPMPYPLNVIHPMGGRLKDGTVAVCGGQDSRWVNKESNELII